MATKPAEPGTTDAAPEPGAIAEKVIAFAPPERPMREFPKGHEADVLPLRAPRKKRRKTVAEIAKS